MQELAEDQIKGIVDLGKTVKISNVNTALATQSATPRSDLSSAEEPSQAKTQTSPRD